MHCPLILHLICSYMWDLTSKTHIWHICGFVLKIGYDTSSSRLGSIKDSKDATLTSFIRSHSIQGSISVFKE